MAGVVTQGARRPGAGRAWAAVLLLTPLLLSPVWSAQGAEDEMVPGGIWHVRAGVGGETQRQAVARDGQSRPLVDYLAGEPGLNRRLSGEVTREVTTAKILATHGISEAWNLTLELPYQVIRQASSLKAPAGDAAAEEAAERFQSRTVSGLGNIRLTSLHRPVFSDSNGLILGWGVAVPGGPQQSDYVGRGTLDTRVPYRALTGLLHYTYYPLGVPRARFDLRFGLDVALRAEVRTPTESAAVLHPPNRGSAGIGWEQEFESVGYGLFLRHEATTQSFLNGAAQEDMTKESRIGAQVSWGNLARLESGPVSFPFQAGLQIDHMVLGYNVPLTTRLTLFYRAYF